MMNFMLCRSFKIIRVLIIAALFALPVQLFGLTRWSALHFVPDADLIEGGQFVVDGQAYYYADTSGLPVIGPTVFATIGIVEYVNFTAGYAGGASLGLKARILGETSPLMPSMAIGAQNIFSHKEAYFYGISNPDTFANEFYVAFGKTIDPLKLRLTLGISSIPTIQTERIDPFIGLEKYFGSGVYVSLEAYRRSQKMVACLFGSWRFMKKHFEVSAGVVDLQGMFFDDNGAMNFSIAARDQNRFVKPGIWMGLRFNGHLGFGSNDGTKGLETRINEHSDVLTSMQKQIDSLKSVITIASRRVDGVSKTLSELDDSSTDESRLKLLVLDKLIAIKSLYLQEPFEPEQVKTAVKELSSFRDRIMPALQEIIVDSKQDIKIRLQGIALLGGMNMSRGADILISVLSKVDDPDLKIEALIALGKMKETRAEYLIKQLSNDPSDAVAFTASEVLQKLEKETGINFSKKGATRDTLMPFIPEKKIDVSGVSPLQNKKMDPSINEPQRALKSNAPSTKTVIVKPPLGSDTLTAIPKEPQKSKSENPTPEVTEKPVTDTSEKLVTPLAQTDVMQPDLKPKKTEIQTAPKAKSSKKEPETW